MLGDSRYNPRIAALSFAMVRARLSLPLMASTMAATMVALSASMLHADCPRTGWERARRIVPAVLIWPAAPFILTAKREKTPIPAAGVRVRVSTKAQGEPVRFVQGAFVSLDSSAVRLVRTDADTLTIVLSDVVCVQVARRSAMAGAGDGTLRGSILGALFGLVRALGERDSDVGGGALVVAPVTYGAFGGMYGALVGTLLGGTSWVTAFERSPPQ